MNRIQCSVVSAQWSVLRAPSQELDKELVFANQPKADEVISNSTLNYRFRGNCQGGFPTTEHENTPLCISPLLAGWKSRARRPTYAARGGYFLGNDSRLSAVIQTAQQQEQPPGRRLYYRMALPMLAILALLLLSLAAQAESSFSALGYGLLRDDANPRAGAMGLSAVAAPDTLCIDLHNPAAWMGSPMTRFGMYASLVSTSTEDAQGRDGSDQTEFNGAALLLPIGDSRFLGITISPASRMKYLWKQEGPAAQDWTAVQLTQEGDGGISQGLVGISTTITSFLRLGLAARGLFGKNESYWQLNFPDADALSTSRTVSDRYNGVGLTAAGYWCIENTWATGLVVNSPVKMQVEQRAIVREGYTSLEDTKGILDVKYETPWDVTFGTARLLDRHLIATEAAWHGWSGVSEPRPLTDSFRDAWRFSGGWEWIPDYRAFDPWWKALTYRAGAYWQNSYVLSPSGHQSAAFALTGGLGIPYFDDQSRFDLSFQYGWRGSKDKDGAAERFFMLSVGLNHKERWFIGRKERR